MIPQNETERLLTEHLADCGIAVERHVELVTFTASGRLRRRDAPPPRRPRRIAHHALARRLRRRHSTVRHTLGLQFTGQAEPNDWILADVHIAGPCRAR